MEPDPVHQVAAAVELMLAIQQVYHEIWSSSRVRNWTENYTPIMSCSKESYAVTQLEIQVLLNPDAHMFVYEEFYQAEPDVVASFMKKLSLKSGLRAWGDKACTSVQSEMKQLHFRNTFKPKH